MKKLGREQQLLEIYKLMHEGKNRNVIYSELTARGYSVSRAAVERDVELIKETKKLVEKGYSENRIFEELRRKGYKFGDRYLRKIIKLRKQAVKEEKKVEKEEEKKYLCARVVTIYHPYKDRTRRIRLFDSEKSEKEIIKMIEEYEFIRCTEYDKIDMETWLCGWKDKNRITLKRLYSVIVIVLEDTICLRLTDFMEFVNNLIVQFEQVEPLKSHLGFLRKVYKALERREKEVVQ